MLELIINPAAGSGRAKETGEKAVACLKEKGVDFRAVYTTMPGEATKLAKEAAGRADTVVAFGGDGTVAEVAMGLQHTGAALGIVPCGTGNDFVKSAGIPKDWKAALELILEKPARPVNSGRMNDTFFMNVCGVGFDVTVLDYAEKAKKHVRGIWPYLYGVLRAIFTFDPKPMHVEIGDRIVDGKFMICAFGNGRFVGGGIPIAPLADLSDGLFDITLIDAVPRWKIPFYLPALLSGRIYQKKKIVHHFRADRGLIETADMRLNLDGEILSLDRAVFQLEKDALLLHW